MFDVRRFMRTVTVPVLQAFDHEGRAVSPGDTITIEPVVAAVLARKGLVSLIKGYTPTYVTRDMAPVPADQDAPSPPNKRRYRRRDLTAEQS